MYHTNLRLPEELATRVADRAEATHVSRNTIVIWALESYLREGEDPMDVYRRQGQQQMRGGEKDDESGDYLRAMAKKGRAGS